MAVSALVGLVAGGLNSGRLSLFPPGLKPSDLAVSAAKTHVLIDMPASDVSIKDRKALPQHLQSLAKRAELVGRVLVTPPVMDLIAEDAGIPPDRISGLARTTGDVPLALSEPASERRASDIRHTQFPYRIEVQARPGAPILDVYTQAPSTAEAERLADNAVPGLKRYLSSLAAEQGVADAEIVTLRQITPARGAPIGGRSPVIIGVLTFMVAFALTCAALLHAIALWRSRLQRGGDAAPEPDARPDTGDSWPRTTRVLPWMLAGFIAMLWLTPFNEIELAVATPIDMKLDRLVLPFVAALWLLALAAGGRDAPRVKRTWIHAAIAAFVASAFLSVVLDARYLSQTLELDLSLKKLPLLISFVSLFLIAASAVRRSEVRAFFLYTLGLAVVVAVGLIFEYRFKQNLFYDLADKLLPGLFTLSGQIEGDAVDHMGRRLVRGPAEVPLEVVTMLSIALPVALVGLMHARRWRARILYGLAACALVAGMFATFRKSGLLAPVAVVLALAYFRRRELLKLAPLGLVLVVVVSVLSPGALGSTVSQFTRSDRLSVPTVSDRAADYDAVRPDVWSHLAFGRGWGSYSHVDYRILDSEILQRTIEMGVVGLLAYLFMGASVVFSARAAIASRDPRWAPLALIGAASAVAFLVASTFYDVMSFPHAAYIFLYMAGLTAVVVSQPVAEAPRRAAHGIGAHPAGRSRRRRAPTLRSARRSGAAR